MKLAIPIIKALVCQALTSSLSFSISALANGSRDEPDVQKKAR
jgi:hypothetical protein